MIIITLDLQCNAPILNTCKYQKMGNIFKKLFTSSKMIKKNSKILMLGLDSAGKTTILYSLKLGKITHTVPTIGFNVQQLQYQKINFMVWDVGGQQKLRNLWNHYYQNSNGLIFVVDSSDEQRIQLSAKQLNRIVQHQEMQNCVILVLANKRDVATMSLDYVCERLGLKKLKRNWAIYPITAIKEQNNGLPQSMQWLITNIDHTQHYIKKVNVG